MKEGEVFHYDSYSVDRYESLVQLTNTYTHINTDRHDENVAEVHMATMRH